MGAGSLWPKLETSDGNIETCASFLVQFLKMPACLCCLLVCRDTQWVHTQYPPGITRLFFFFFLKSWRFLCPVKLKFYRTLNPSAVCPLEAAELKEALCFQSWLYN